MSLLLLLEKANGNFPLTCPLFYALSLIKELGLLQNSTSANKTYFQLNKTNNQVISDQNIFLEK